MTADRRRVAILISGRGSNMRALVEQADGYDVVLVASNKPPAEGLDWARDRGLPTWAQDSRGVDRVGAALVGSHGRQMHLVPAGQRAVRVGRHVVGDGE